MKIKQKTSHRGIMFISKQTNPIYTVVQMTPTKVDFAVKTRPCLISEARNFLKPSSSSTAVNPNGSKNPSGSLAPICWEGWNDACAAKTTVLAHVKDLWKQIYAPNVPKIHIDITLLSVLKISACMRVRLAPPTARQT